MNLPWDRPLPGEKRVAFAVFCAYRDTPPPRILEKVWAAYTGKKGKRISGRWWLWKRKFHWEERVYAKDAEEEKRQRDARFEEWRKDLKQQILSGRLKRQRAIEKYANASYEEIPWAVASRDIDLGAQLINDANEKLLGVDREKGKKETDAQQAGDLRARYEAEVRRMTEAGELFDDGIPNDSPKRSRDESADSRQKRRSAITSPSVRDHKRRAKKSAKDCN